MDSRPDREEASILARALRESWPVTKVAEVLRFYRRNEYSQADVAAVHTEAAPGTAEKIKVMQERVAAGKAPCHWGDPWHAANDRTHLEATRKQNGRDVDRHEERDTWDDEDDGAEEDYDAAPRRYFLKQGATDETDSIGDRQDRAG